MKTRLFLLGLFFLVQNSQSQTDITSEQLSPVETHRITGDTADYTGNSISFSTDGSVLAVGEYGYGTVDRVSSGRVRVYVYQSNEWVQKGQDLLGVLDSFNTFGKKISLSSDGNTLAVYDSQIGITLNAGETLEDKYGSLAPEYYPYLQVYQFQNGVWTQAGANFLDSFTDMSLSGDGLTLALSNTNGTMVYEFVSDNWIQVGLTLPEGKIALSEDGKTMVMGNKNYSDPNTVDLLSYEGQVKVYKNISNTWTQYGSAIIGTSYLEHLGSTISISANGSIIAVGSSQSNATDIVKIYELSSSNFNQLGNNIEEEVSSIELSDNGEVIIIGGINKARVLNYSENSWQQANTDIDGDEISKGFGYAVSISGDGAVYAVGAPNIQTNDGTDGLGSTFKTTKIDKEEVVDENTDGYVAIYKNNENSITLYGDEIYGHGTYNVLGKSVDVSDNGNIIAVGAPNSYNNNGDIVYGHARVYKKTIDGLEQIGEDIRNTSDYDTGYFGAKVALSANGSILAVSAPSLYNSDYGAVYIYKRNGNSWEVLGNTIFGTYGSGAGSSICFSKDGTILAIGFGGNPSGVTGDNHTGYTTVYKYSNTNQTWEVLGARINGEATWDFSGSSIHLSGDGSVLAIGAVGNDGDTTNNGGHGHVRVFKYNNNSWEQRGSDIDGDVDFNSNFGGVVKLSNDGNTLMVSDLSTQVGAGSVELYNWNETASEWNHEIQLKTYTGSLFNNSYRFKFGSDISMSDDGNVLVIGEKEWRDLSGSSQRGKVHIYIKTDTDWVESELFLTGRHRLQYFGSALSLSGNGNTLVVAGDNYGYYDDNVASYAGMVGVYHLNLSSSLDGFEVFDGVEDDTTLSAETILTDGKNIINYTVKNRKIITEEAISLDIINFFGQKVKNENLKGMYILKLEDKKKGNKNSIKIYVK